jgi:hypothetical protein
MRLRSPRIILVTVAIAVAPLIGGCGLLGGDGPDIPPEDAAAKARERVQSYLQAMKAKDVLQGRSQFCAVLQNAFDTAATSPNGDFADHFTVSDATITEVRADGDAQKAHTLITVAADGKSSSLIIDFTVTKIDGVWCIAGEMPGDAKASGAPTPNPQS